jgi:hypothetical protein
MDILSSGFGDVRADDELGLGPLADLAASWVPAR